MKYFSVLCAMALLFACEKKNDDPVKERTYYLDSVVTSQGYMYTYEYNADSLLSNWTYFAQPIRYTLRYNNGVMIAVDTTTNLAVQGKQEATLTVTPSLVVNNYGYGVDSSFFNANGELTDRISHYKYSPGVDHYYLTWSNGNVTKVVRHELAGDRVTSDSIVTEWTYDNKPSMYTSAKALAIGEHVLFSRFNVLSKNNMISQKHQPNVANSMFYYNYTYEYNSAGYPVKQMTVLLFELGTIKETTYDTARITYK